VVARPPVRERRPRPSPGRIAARRLGALAVLLAAAGIGVWVATSAIGGNDTKATTTVDNRPLRIVFPEGFTRKQMAQRITAVDRIARTKRDVDPILSARSYLRVTRKIKVPKEFAPNVENGAAEGFLFPALYDFTAGTTSRELVRDQLAAFRRTFGRVKLSYAKSRNLTPYDVLIIASLVEKEVIAPNERPLVAAVIYNRLHNRMPLQIDASLRYGLGIPPGQTITQKDLDTQNPYNTTLNHSLPPTPIANPGLASMQAAAHPAKVDYLYFVRKPDKVHHFFTSNLDTFNAYIAAHPVKGA
jgi:peptidoglycan lytic transglycosylase G